MLPSTLPSMYSDSVPLISPLMNRPLPMVACSPEVGAAGRLGASNAGAGAVGREGSGVGLEVTGPVWLGFHIAVKVVPFLS